MHLHTNGLIEMKKLCTCGLVIKDKSFLFKMSDHPWLNFFNSCFPFRMLKKVDLYFETGVHFGNLALMRSNNLIENVAF